MPRLTGEQVEEIRARDARVSMRVLDSARADRHVLLAELVALRADLAATDSVFADFIADHAEGWRRAREEERARCEEAVLAQRWTLAADIIAALAPADPAPPSRLLARLAALRAALGEVVASYHDVDADDASRHLAALNAARAALEADDALAAAGELPG
jgi:hypothetical protein